MQLGILQLLLGLPQGALTQGQGQGGAATGIFAQLLGGDGGDPAPGGQQTPTGQILTSEIVPNALIAQEVPAEGEIEALSELLGKEISADDAQALLEQFDTMMQDGEPNPQAPTADAMPDELMQQVKSVLTEIRDSGKPQTVGAMIAQLPALQAAPVERAPVVERMLSWLKNTLKKEVPQEVATEQLEEPSRSPLVQSLQAAMFSADPATATEAQTDSTRDYIEIVPLSATLEAKTPTWVKQITATPLPVRADLDAAIPALTPAKEILPSIDLPSMDRKVADLADFRAVLEQPTAQQSDAPDAPVLSATHAPSRTESPHIPTVAAPHQVMNHAPVVGQVHVAITRAKDEGIDQLTIQLEPADLGRVEVKMSTSAEGHTQLTFLVDKAETLDSLARDARSLERALQEAGVKADSGSMQFNLRQQSQQAMSDGSGQQHGRPHWGAEPHETVTPHAAAAATHHYTLTLRDGVDIRA